MILRTILNHKIIQFYTKRMVLVTFKC